MILVDTSVWIDHLHRTIPSLVEALEDEDVLTHPFVIGELACGRLKDRGVVLDSLTALPAALVASHEEVLIYIDERRLMGKGLGYIDAHLLASGTLTAGVRLWTRDKHLRTVAISLGVAFEA